MDSSVVPSELKEGVVRCYFELTTPLLPYKGDDRVPASSSESFQLSWSGGYTADGMGRLIALIRKELSDILGPLNDYPWSHGTTITRTFDTREDYDEACRRIAEFVREHNDA